MVLVLVPIHRDAANAFVREHHRHHKPVVGYKFALGVEDDGRLVGVTIVGRPVSRGQDDRRTLEMTRTCTDGTPNVNSKLYAAAWRATRALGYGRLITYTLPQESGASLRGAGWRVVGEVEGRSWSRPSRPRVDKHPIQRKLLWEVR